MLSSPRIEADFECLIDIELPFEEDIRRYKFPPLNCKLTVSGKVITEHNDLPTADLTAAAMNAYVDATDLWSCPLRMICDDTNSLLSIGSSL
jgi:ATP-dependent DNA helicase 2 subunit 2